MSRTCAPTTAGEIRCVLKERLSAPVGTPVMAHIDRELTPMIAELSSLGPMNEEHPTVSQVFSWLIDLKHTAEEFTYVIGPLERHVYGIMMDHFRQYLWKSNFSFIPEDQRNVYTYGIMEGHFGEYCPEGNIGSCVQLGKISLEALAERCPLLEGSWETAAWFVVKLTRCYNMGQHEKLLFYVSDRVSSWIMHMISDHDICPNPYLRIELMHLFPTIKLNDHNRPRAIESVISAFSGLNIDYLTGGCDTRFFNVDLCAITRILEMVGSQEYRHKSVLYVSNINANIRSSVQFISSRVEDERANRIRKNSKCMYEFDEKLAYRMNSMLNSRLSTMLHDVAFLHSENTSRYIESMEFKGLAALLMTITACIQLEYNRFLEEGLHEDQEDHLDILSHTFLVISTSFRKCLETPQLIQSAASSVMVLLEYVLLTNEALLDAGRSCSYESLNLTRIVLKKLIFFDDDITTSPIGKQILFYEKRLKNINGEIEAYKDTDKQYPSIFLFV